MNWRLNIFGFSPKAPNISIGPFILADFKNKLQRVYINRASPLKTEPDSYMCFTNVTLGLCPSWTFWIIKLRLISLKHKNLSIISPEMSARTNKGKSKLKHAAMTANISLFWNHSFNHVKVFCVCKLHTNIIRALQSHWRSNKYMLGYAKQDNMCEITNHVARSTSSEEWK